MEWKKWGSWMLFSFVSRLKADEGSFTLPDDLKHRIGLVHRNAGPEKPAPKHQQVLRLSICDGSYENQNPYYSQNTAEDCSLAQIFEGLLRRNIDGKFEGACAESWSYDPENFTWTFKLRPDLKWNNGEKLTAHDFVRGIRAKFDPESYPHQVIPESVRSALIRFWSLKGAYDVLEKEGSLDKLGVEALDELTLKLQWAEPCNPTLSIDQFEAINCFPLHTNYLQQIKYLELEVMNCFPTYPGYVKKAQSLITPESYSFLVTNGPFKLASLLQGSGFTLKKNYYYWDAQQVWLEEVRYIHFPREVESIEAWKNGAVDISLELNSWGLRDLKPEDFKYLTSYASASCTKLEFNMKFPSVQDWRVRQAINLILDRKDLGRLFFLPSKAELHVFGEERKRKPGWAGWSMASRIHKAKQLMEAAGYHKDKKLKLKLSLIRDDDDCFLKGLLRAFYVLGDYLEIDAHPFERRAFSAARKGEGLELCVATFGPISFHPFIFYQGGYSGKIENNVIHFRNKAYDQAIEALKEATSEQASEKILQKLETILLEETPMIPLFVRNPYYLVSEKVGGWRRCHRSPICPTGKVMCRFLFKKAD